MKKQLYSFVMMLALVIVAGTAMAQGTGIAPYQGQTYTYTLNGITVINASTAAISYSGAGGVPSVASIAIAAATTGGTISFDVAYNSSAAAGTLSVTITDDVTGCPNFINLSIVPVAPPTLSLVVARTTAAEICQVTNGSPANNTAASVPTGTAPLINTVTFTVTPTMSSGGASYAFDFKLNDYLYGGTAISMVHSGTGTAIGTTDISVSGATGVQTFTVTFVTTAGKANETITGTASNAVLTALGTGTGTYTGTIDPTNASAVVKSIPAIGVFTY